MSTVDSNTIPDGTTSTGAMYHSPPAPNVTCQTVASPPATARWFR